MTSKDATLAAEAFSFSIGPRTFAVMSVPLASRDFGTEAAPSDAASVGGGLTWAERDVLRLALGGHTNMDIAALRKSSPRTVANQMAALFRKLGVASRGELAALCLRAIAVARAEAR